jgi:nitrogen regulatory protein P-II 2
VSIVPVQHLYFVFTNIRTTPSRIFTGFGAHACGVLTPIAILKTSFLVRRRLAMAVRKEITMAQSMKFVRATVRPWKLDEILEALARVGIHTPTVTEIKVYGQKGSTEIYRGTEFTLKFLPMLKIEAAVPSDQIERVTAAIADAAKTGQIGEGEILVFDLEPVQQMRLGEIVKHEPRRAA